MPAAASYQYRIVADQNFIVATRDAGYRNLATALAELIDNAIQAGATCVRIFADCGTPSLSQIAVLDDGSGMSAPALRMALQFGGTTRFNDRSGQGRFGMGLPNSSLSQARRVDVYSWLSPEAASYSYLDLDAVANGKLRYIPRPQAVRVPSWALEYAGPSGTLVIWRNCDRVPTVEKTALIQHLHVNFARMYRYHLWDGFRLLVNDQQVFAIDPLLCDRRAALRGATEFQTPLFYTMKVPREPQRTAQVRVRFAEFPIAKWHGLSSADKRSRGITRRAGVSIVRGNREVAYGWYFMGAKRKENYDDWWRCEITFDPELDEYFGVTNTKQQISPVPELEDTLSKDLEPMARLLNSRVRATFNTLRKDSPAARLAVVRDRLLPPATSLVSSSCVSVDARRKVHSSGFQYKIEEAASSDDSFYSIRLSGAKLIVVLNTNHPFHRHFFQNKYKDGSNERYRLECLLFALARAEAEIKNERELDFCRRRRIRWSNVLATFLGN
jgi:hypothetical protein